MGYDFDLSKMPADMQSIYYQVAAKEGNKTKIDSELEYSIFFSRTKRLLNSGNAKYTEKEFKRIFKLDIKTPDLEDAKLLVKLSNPKADDIEVEKLNQKTIKYTITIGNIEKKDYVQNIGYLKTDGQNLIKDNNSYTFFDDGSYEARVIKK